MATASALGLSGLALAGPDDRSGDPDSITLRERTSITEMTTPSSTPVNLAGILDDTADSRQGLDSPFDDPNDSLVISASADSPAQQTDQVSAQSPAPASPVSAASPVSPASAPTADSVGSGDDSAGS